MYRFFKERWKTSALMFGLTLTTLIILLMLNIDIKTKPVVSTYELLLQQRMATVGTKTGGLPSRNIFPRKQKLPQLQQTEHLSLSENTYQSIKGATTTTTTQALSRKVQNQCVERRHVIYVRIPKTGSSTMTFLIWRFGLARGLRFLLPRPGFEGNQPTLAMNSFHLPQRGKHCDLMANHVFYNYQNFKSYFPADTVLITLLRHPMAHVYSSIYFIKGIKASIPGENKVSEYLLNPESFECKRGHSFTHNPMASYLGLKEKDFGNTDKIQEKISELDRRFGTILILEKLDESLILLKRSMCWPLKDVIYMVKNKNENKPLLNITQADHERLRQWSTADYAIYEHFEAKLQEQMGKEGVDFKNELDLFRKIRNQTMDFCEQTGTSQHSLSFKATRFSSAFEITKEDCNIMKMGGRPLLNKIRLSQKATKFCNVQRN